MEARSFKSENMMINYNGKFFNSNLNTVKFNNRAMNYGDGIFETMIYHNQEIALLLLHWERLREGAEILKIELPFDVDQLRNHILELIKKNELPKKRVRVKLLLWRSSGGLYAPENNGAEYCLSVSKIARPKFKQLQKVFTATSVTLQHTKFSHLKTLSALPYVLAGIEKKEREADELILTDNAGHIAEASASNLFIYSVKEDVFYTPALFCGGINGVSRRFLLQQMTEKNVRWKEVRMRVDQLNEDTAVFTCNVTGINQISCIDGRELNSGEQAFYILNNLFPFTH